MSVTISLPEGANWQTAVTSDGDEGRIDPRTGYLHVEMPDGGLKIKRDWKDKTRAAPVTAILNLRGR